MNLNLLYLTQIHQITYKLLTNRDEKKIEQEIKGLKKD